MNLRTHLINRIDDALSVSGKSERAFCILAGVNHKVIARLRREESVTLATLEKLERLVDTILSKPSDPMMLSSSDEVA